MAYTPKTWTCGETITDEGLNNIEQGIQEALGCCDGGLPEVTTADNGDVLTVVDGEWAKAEPGYKCTTGESTVTFFNGSLTTANQGGAPCAVAQFTPLQAIAGDSLTVTVDGTEYELPKSQIVSGGYGEFGSGGVPIFTTYPCAIIVTGGTNLFATPNNGTYSVKIQVKVTAENVETSECFEKAVKSLLRLVVHVQANGTGYIADKTFAEINEAAGKGIEVIATYPINDYAAQIFRMTIYSNYGVTFSSERGVFTDDGDIFTYYQIDIDNNDSVRYREMSKDFTTP